MNESIFRKYVRNNACTVSNINIHFQFESFFLMKQTYNMPIALYTETQKL